MNHRILHVFPIQNTAAFFVHDLSLFVVYPVIIQQIFTDTEVVILDLLLGLFDRPADGFVLDLFPFRYAEGVVYRNHPLRSKQSHQIVFQGQVKLRFTRVSLPSGTSSELIVNTPGFMTLCTDDL